MTRKILFILFSLYQVCSFAQADIFSYQLALRGADGNPPAQGTNIALRISILDGSATGEQLYREIHNQGLTNNAGIVNLQVGNGSSKEGDIATINWSTTRFIKTEVDLAGGSNFTDMGATQILGVPFAMQAKRANTADNATNSTNSTNSTNAVNALGAIDKFVLTDAASGNATTDGLKLSLNNGNTLFDNQENGHFRINNNNNIGDFVISNKRNFGLMPHVVHDNFVIKGISGSVGIGISNPTNNLHIHDSSNARVSLGLSHISGSDFFQASIVGIQSNLSIYNHNIYGETRFICRKAQADPNFNPLSLTYDGVKINGKIQKGTGDNPFAFQVTSTGSNSIIINNSTTSAQNSSDLLFVTHKGVAANVNTPIYVKWDGTNWVIYSENGANIPAGEIFNVFVVN